MQRHNRLRFALFIAFAGFSCGFIGAASQAHELDKEALIPAEQVRYGSALPRTVIVRSKGGRSEVMEMNRPLSAQKTNKAAIAKAKFHPLNSKGPAKGELDQDSSASSWYFWCPPSYGGYYQPTYYYYGYSYAYAPYYGYFYGGYSYQYYHWPYFY